jgi:hypothetical protein
MTLLRFTSLMACLVFICPSLTDGQEIANASVPTDASFQMHDQPPLYDQAQVYEQLPFETNSLPAKAVLEPVRVTEPGCQVPAEPQLAPRCHSDQGRRCYGGCDQTRYVPSTSHDTADTNVACHNPCERCGKCRSLASSGCAGHGPHSCGRRCLLRDVWHKDQAYFQYETDLLCPGERMYRLLEPQKTNGRVAQLAFYRFHFQLNPDTQLWQFTRSGQSNLEKLMRILPITPGTILVGPTDDPVADENRLQLVRDALAHASTTQASVEVALGKPRGTGLSGAEALQIYQQRQLGSPYNYSSRSPAIGAGFNATPLRNRNSAPR